MPHLARTDAGVEQKGDADAIADQMLCRDQPRLFLGRENIKPPGLGGPARYAGLTILYEGVRKV
jgi:hypothetical protein